MPTPTRVYHVQMDDKDYLVEAVSKEQAVQRATSPLVKSVTIPTPMETLRLQRDGAIMLFRDDPDVELEVVLSGEGEPLPPVGESVEGERVAGGVAELPAVDVGTATPEKSARKRSAKQ